MKIIVNADDLGISYDINDAIFEMMALGRVTSATILANGPAMEDAVKKAKYFPECSFGVHLNAAQFLPLTSEPGLKKILNASGVFTGNNCLRKLRIDGSLRSALVAEWCEQVEKIRAAGLFVSHLDSHDHLHTVPGVFPALKKVQAITQVKKIRLTRNVFPMDTPPSLSKEFSKFLFNFTLKNYRSTVTTDGFTSLENFVQVAVSLLGKYRSIELMVHPGDKNLKNETELLSTEWWNRIPFPIEFISYNDL
jgi:predicted glycoside hydrolase/deacetylase ChbG (UPF0249 family)